MPAARRQRGDTMIEVLVTVIIIAVGVLGAAALQVTTLKNLSSSHSASCRVAPRAQHRGQGGVRVHALYAGCILQEVAGPARADPHGLAITGLLPRSR